MIEVFSKRTDKPRHYPFLKPSQTGLGAKKYLGFNPIEFSTSPDGKTWTSCYDVANLSGVYCYRAPDVPPAKRTDNVKKVGFQDGSRLMSTTFDSRQLKIELLFSGVDETDALLALESAQRFLVAREPYWIAFGNWQNRMYYGTATMGDPNYLSDKAWTCEVTFTDLMGLSRSIGTSLSSTEDMWGVNDNIPNNGDYPSFSFSINGSGSFSVYNFSDVMIDPERRGHPFKMTCKGQGGTNMTVTNQTTNTILEKETAFDGTFVLDGVNPLLNGEGCLLDIYQGDTSSAYYGIITLQIGKNDFKVENFSGTISFDFPMWWLS